MKPGRAVLLAGFFGLIFWLIAWHAWLSPSQNFPVAVMLLFFVTPLLLPMRGILADRRQPQVWALFLSFPYFAHGVVEAVSNPPERVFASVEIGFAVLLFLGVYLNLRRGNQASS